VDLAFLQLIFISKEREDDVVAMMLRPFFFFSQKKIDMTGLKA
jgi:hypothetical protein